MRINVLFWTLCVCVAPAFGARILGIFYMTSYSHFRLGEILLKELAARGHEVTMLSPYPQKTAVKNYRDIAIPEITEIMKKRREDRNLFDIDSAPRLLLPIMVGQICTMLAEETFRAETVQKLLQSNETFDLIIMEQFLNDAHQGFAYHFKAPSIAFSTIGSSLWTNRLVGNPAPPSYVAAVFLSYSSNMNFFQRTVNAFAIVLEEIYAHLWYFPKQNEILHKYIPGAPHIYNLIYNTSLVLVNSHVSYRPAVPHVPNMIEIGGFHVQKPRQLPDELQKFLDEADEGVVYFSMGSNLKSKEMHPDKLANILKVFGKLKMKVLWKWEDEDLPGLPANVKIAKWLPQQDILAHPNVRIFITHGGLLSIIEAIHYGIPLIGIPVLADQRMNMADAEEFGYGITVSYKDLNENTLGAALNEMIENPKFRTVAKSRSQILRDQPVKPVDSAVYWIEYVIKHKGAPHMRASSVALPWYQYFLLDVIIFLFSFIFIVTYLIYFIIKKFCCGKSKTKIE